VKAAMAEMGFCEEILRLPLVSMEEKKRKVLMREINKIRVM